jgi:hypothetical protein
MWTIEHTVSGSTNKFTIVADGKINVTFPPGVRVKAYVNEVRTPVEALDVKAGDIVYFKLKNTTTEPKTVTVEHLGTTSILELAAHSAASSTYEEDTMSPTDTLNLFAGTGMGNQQGGAMGAGLGAGLVGGLLGTALFGRNGLNGFGSDGVAVGAPATLAGVESVVNNAAIMSQLADVKASVPLAEGQVQLALAQAQMNLSAGQAASTGSVIGSISAFENSVMNNLNMQTQMNQKGFSDNAATTVAQGTANLLATKDASILAERNSWALNQAITNDGDKTRALIQSIDKTNDSRLITSLSNEITELRNEGRLRGVEGNITISNNNTANAVAQQQQSQQQAQQLAVLGAQLNALWTQNQHIQQGVLNIGSGTVSGNSQTAANTRVS